MKRQGRESANQPTINNVPLSPGSIPDSSLPASPPVSGLPSTVYCLPFILAFAIFFSALAVQQHRAFQTNGLDLGNVDQALWNTAQGNFLHFTLMMPVQSRLALHVEPILLLLVPFYWLNLGGPEMLLIVQAVVVALGAWPLYQIANYELRIINLTSSLPNPDKPEPKRMNNLTQRCQDAKAQKIIQNFASLFLCAFAFDSLPQKQGFDYLGTKPYVLRLMPSLLASLLCLAYLLLPTLEAAVLFDFHAVTLASTFLLLAFWSLERQKDTSFIIFALLAMACKEDMPLVTAMLGLYAALAQRRWRLAGLTIGLSAAWFALAFLVIQPAFAAEGNIQLNRYAWLGHGPLDMVKTALTQPGLVFNHLWVKADLPGYLFSLFFPTAFLALFSPLTLLPMLPTLAVNLLSDNPFTWRLEEFHYGAPLAPFLFISAVKGIRQIGQWLGIQKLRFWTPVRAASKQTLRQPPNHPTTQLLCYAATMLLLTCTLVYHTYRGFTPLGRPYLWPPVTAHHRQLEEVLAAVPPAPAAVVFAQSNLAPHLTQRPFIYTDFAYFTNPAYPAPAPVTDIVLDVTTFENSGGLHQFLRQNLLESGDYQLVAARDGILHLQRLTANGQLQPSALSSQPSFYTFTQPDSPPAYPLAVDFGDDVRLQGYTLHFNRQEEIQVSVDLAARQPLPADLRPVLYLLDTSGQPEGATPDLPPALVWYPPDQWPVGETVRVRFNTLPWYTRQTPAYRLALGFVTGSDVWNVSRRLHPTLPQPAAFAARLPAGGTLVELARFKQVWGLPTGGPVTRSYEAPALAHPLQVNFDNQIKLLGYTPPQVVTNTLTISLNWQAVSTPPSLTRFVQLVGPDGQIYGQNDSALDNGAYPTFLWEPGEVVSEIVTLPLAADRPPGRYTLHLGLYYPDTGQRLPLASGGDHVEIPLE